MSSSTPEKTALWRRLVVVATCCVALALLAGYAGRWLWPLDLFAHFRIQYTIALIVLALALLALRERVLAALAGAVALLAGASVVAYTGWPTGHAEAAAAQFRLATFNVWFRNRDSVRIARYLESIAPDVVVLQEITAAQAARLSEHMPSYPHLYLAPASPHGAVVMSRWPIVTAEAIDLTPGGARAASVKIRWRDRDVNVIGAHLHWPLGRDVARLRNRELVRLAELARATEGPLLIGGDFNVTPWSSHFQDMVAASGLHDCARGHGLAPSWPAQLPLLGIRIDQCLASDHWRIVDSRTGPRLGSDHYPTINDFELRRNPQLPAKTARAGQRTMRLMMY